MTEKELTNDEKAARLIWSEALQRSSLPFTWGLDFSSVKTIERGTAFHVKAAWVHIQYLRQMDFKLTILPDDDEQKQIVYGKVKLANLVSTIDDALVQGGISDNSLCVEYEFTPEKVAV